MLHIPALRWGEPYQSLEKDTLVHFATGEPIAEMSRCVGMLVQRDLRQAKRARKALLEIPAKQLVQMAKKAAELYLHATLPLGNGTQSPEDFVRMQSATTGLPLHMCRANMKKNHFVLSKMDEILDALTRGLDIGFLGRGYGVESRGVPISYQAQSPVLGMVLPNNSPGVHALWLPVIPLQIGLVIKPGSAEPWTPYRIAQAWIEAGVPKQALSLYPGGHDVGAAVMQHCQKSLIFGGQATVEQYKTDPRVQVHGPGWSKIVLGEDACDHWADHLQLMVDSVALNGGRSCINCSAIYTPRRGRELAEALAARLGPIEPLPPEDPNAALAAFTQPVMAQAIWNEIERELQVPGAVDLTARFGPRLVQHERHAYLRPMVVHCSSPEHPLAKKEYLFPFVAVVDCPQEQIVEAIGSTLVCTAITKNPALQLELLEATNIDRLNLGPLPTMQLNWLQPHEGNLIDFLFKNRAFQFVPETLAV